MKQFNSKIIIFAFIFLLSSYFSSVYGETPSDLTEEFFQSFIEGKDHNCIDCDYVKVAFDKIFKNSIILELNPTSIDELRKKTKFALTVYGNAYGFQKVKETNYGEPVKKLTYLLFLEKHPLAWEFFYYKPNIKNGDQISEEGELLENKKWKLSQIVFNDRFQDID